MYASILHNISHVVNITAPNSINNVNNTDIEANISTHNVVNNNISNVDHIDHQTGSALSPNISVANTEGVL